VNNAIVYTFIWGSKYDIYSHQNEHIVRLTPEQLKQKMAEKEANRA